MKHKTEFLKYLNTARIQGLADAIFAIAMTLLVLAIQIPELPGKADNPRIIKLLIELIPRFYVFALSFVLLASFWKIHHRQFHWINRLDETLLGINMIWFLTVVIVPFSSSLVGEHGSLTVASLFFHINLFCIGLFAFLSWGYAIWRGLVEQHLTRQELNYETCMSMILPVTAVIAAIVSIFVPSFSSLTYFLIIPIKFIVRKIFGYRLRKNG
ncbi:MAG: DUF1211 domain-containing protein [Spirochaetales bacterium]|nr:DUF1211 domain-containing protein [Spirochaetales bacterium]